jgi:hypothetical protein
MFSPKLLEYGITPLKKTLVNVAGKEKKSEIDEGITRL